MTEHAQNPLPGAELVQLGLADLAHGVESIEALLVRIGAPRLARLGVDVPADPSTEPAEHRLYALLCRTRGRRAYGDYNSLIRRLVSYERALEAEVARKRREGSAS